MRPQGIKIWVWAAVWSWGFWHWWVHETWKKESLHPSASGSMSGTGKWKYNINWVSELCWTSPKCSHMMTVGTSLWLLVLGPRIMEMDLSSMWLFSKKQQFVFMYKPEHCLPGVWPCQAPGGGLLWWTRRNKCELSGWSPWWGRVQRTTAGALRPSLGQMGLLVLSSQAAGTCGAWKTAKGTQLNVVGSWDPPHGTRGLECFPSWQDLLWFFRKVTLWTVLWWRDDSLSTLQMRPQGSKKLRKPRNHIASN